MLQVVGSVSSVKEQQQVILSKPMRLANMLLLTNSYLLFFPDFIAAYSWCVRYVYAFLVLSKLFSNYIILCHYIYQDIAAILIIWWRNSIQNYSLSLLWISAKDQNTSLCKDTFLLTVKFHCSWRIFWNTRHYVAY